MIRFKSKGQKIFVVFMCVVLIAAAAIAATMLLLPKPIKDFDGDGIQVVACIGDSITVEGRVEQDDSKTYPGLLQGLLGDKYQINNYGIGGRHMQKLGINSYWKNNLFTKSQQGNPDVVIIMLGTNDSRPEIWNADAYAASAEEMVEIYQGLPSSPKVYLMKPPAVFEVAGTFNTFGIDPSFIATEIGPIIDRVAQNTGAAVIDIYAITKDHPEYYSDEDGVHPNAEGISSIASTVYNAIIG